MTLKELKELLTEKYLEFIYEPNVSLELANYRPVTIFIHGEVNSPGLYTLQYIVNKNCPTQVINF